MMPGGIRRKRMILRLRAFIWGVGLGAWMMCMTRLLHTQRVYVNFTTCSAHDLRYDRAIAKSLPFSFHASLSIWLLGISQCAGASRYSPSAFSTIVSLMSNLRDPITLPRLLARLAH